MMNWLIKNARKLESQGETAPIEIRIKDGKIAEIGESLQNQGEKEFDANGSLYCTWIC